MAYVYRAIPLPTPSPSSLYSAADAGGKNDHGTIRSSSLTAYSLVDYAQQEGPRPILPLPRSYNSGSNYSYLPLGWSNSAPSPYQVNPNQVTGSYSSLQNHTAPSTVYLHNHQSIYHGATLGRSASVPGMAAEGLSPFSAAPTPLLPSPEFNAAYIDKDEDFHIGDYLSDPLDEPEPLTSLANESNQSPTTTGLGITTFPQDGLTGIRSTTPSYLYRDPATDYFSPYHSSSASASTPSSTSGFEGTFEMEEDVLQRVSRSSSIASLGSNPQQTRRTAAHALYRAGMLSAYSSPLVPEHDGHSPNLLAPRPSFDRCSSSSGSISGLGGDIAQLNMLNTSTASSSSDYYGVHPTSIQSPASTDAVLEYYQQRRSFDGSYPIVGHGDELQSPEMDRSYAVQTSPASVPRPHFATNLFGPQQYSMDADNQSEDDQSYQSHSRQRTVTRDDGTISARKRQSTVRGTALQTAFQSSSSPSHDAGAPSNLPAVGLMTSQIEKTAQGTLKGTRRPMDGKNPTTVGCFVPIDETTPFHLMHTKKSRGRRPLDETDLGLENTQPLGETSYERVTEAAGTTRGGKPKKIFLCKVPGCGKVFKRSEHLKRHVRSLHTDEKPFECPVESCGKKFSRVDNLNQHTKTHGRKDRTGSTVSSNRSESPALVDSDIAVAGRDSTSRRPATKRRKLRRSDDNGDDSGSDYVP